MKKFEDLSLHPISVVLVENESDADITLDTRDTVIDFLSLGTACLYNTITGNPSNEIKVFKTDLSLQESGVMAYMESNVYKVTKDSFMSISCKYCEEIANYIAEKKCLNNMILGPMASNAISMYCLGHNMGVGLAPHYTFLLEDILPEIWDMYDTTMAQEFAFDFIQKMYMATVEPFEPKI